MTSATSAVIVLLSTVAYALVNTSDWALAACFARNAFCCAIIIGVVEWNRRRSLRRIWIIPLILPNRA